MDTIELLQRIGNIEDNLDKLKNSIFAMKMTDIQKYPANYEELSTDAALRSERITCNLRNLIYATIPEGKAAYMERAAKTHGIEIGFDKGILTLRLPGLLPKRKVHTNTACQICSYSSLCENIHIGLLAKKHNTSNSLADSSTLHSLIFTI